MEGFLRRNPILRTKRARNIDSVRVNGATTAIIKSWFQRLFIPAYYDTSLTTALGTHWNEHESEYGDANRSSRRILKT